MDDDGNDRGESAGQAQVIRVDRARAAQVVERALLGQRPDSPLAKHLCATVEEVDAVIAAVRGLTLAHVGQGYRPSGQVDGWSVLIGVGAGLLVMLPLAWVFSRIPYSLIVISALILAGATVWAVKKFAVIRHTALALALGALLGGGSYLAWQWFEYQEFRDGLRADIQALSPALPPAQQEALVDQAIENEIGSPGLLGYLRLHMRGNNRPSYGWEPPSITDLLPINIIEVSGVGFLIVKVLELGAATALGASMLNPRSGPPTCEAHQVTMQERRLFPALPADARRITAPETGRMRRGLASLESAAYLMITACPTCQRSYLHWRHKRRNDRAARALPLGHLDGAGTQAVLAAAGPAAETYTRRELITFVRSVQAAQRTADADDETPDDADDGGPTG